MGLATSRIRPNSGCSTSTIISRAWTCSSASAWRTSLTGAHGTCPRRSSSHSAVVRVAKRARRSGTSSSCGRADRERSGSAGPRSARGAPGSRRDLARTCPCCRRRRSSRRGWESSGPARGSGGRSRGCAPATQSRLSVQIGEVGEHAHRGVEERDVHVAADARALGVEEADHEPDHGGVAAREVDDGDAALARRPVGLAGDRHVARVALDQVVVGRARPRAAPSCRSRSASSRRCAG